MYNFERFLKNSINEKECKDINVVAFIQDHVNKLKEQKSLFDNVQFINETDYLLRKYATTLHECNLLKVKRKEETNVVDELITKYKKTIHGIENLSVFLFEKDSTAYKCIFPDGITEITNTTKVNLIHHLNSMEQRMKKYENKLGKGLIIEFTKLKNTLLQTREKQLRTINKLDELTSLKNNQKKELLKLFQRNIYYAYIKNFDNTILVKKLFKQSILNVKSNRPELLISLKNTNGNGISRNGIKGKIKASNFKPVVN